MIEHRVAVVAGTKEFEVQQEKPTLTSLIIRPKVAPKPFIRTINVGNRVGKAIRNASFNWRPYVLMVFFDTQLMIAESSCRA
ncbi:MAG: hypothetical protein B9J98_05630 [Candidatus Terraquivivens tikiterensis]|uniref:Uncharacterized protein n=1 Tax=Candidatus Terraquivivens tikiterensis TaxID=1980982 RepID=A0A2R7Y295_9ARCH|nr:MAG: hypothetical protein B9J98_05630 [Candidatus Terraquivivens tikiterensis]